MSPVLTWAEEEHMWWRLSSNTTSPATFILMNLSRTEQDEQEISSVSSAPPNLNHLLSLALFLFEGTCQISLTDNTLLLHLLSVRYCGGWRRLEEEEEAEEEECAHIWNILSLILNYQHEPKNKLVNYKESQLAVASFNHHLHNKAATLWWLLQIQECDFSSNYGNFKLPLFWSLKTCCHAG